MDTKNVIIGLWIIGCSWISGALVMKAITRSEIAKKDQRIKELEMTSSLQDFMISAQKIIIDHDNKEDQKQETK